MSGTNLGKMPILIVALVIGIIMATTAILPLASDYSEAKTFTNEGYYRMSIPTEEYVITYNPSVDGKSVIGINGEKYDLINDIPAYASRSIAFAENYIVRMFNDGGAGTFSLQLWNSAFVVGVGSGTFTGTITITINDGTLTWANSTTELSTDYSYTGDMICIDPSGDMILKKADSKSYVLKDSTIIYGGGISLLKDTTYSGIYLEGTVEDYDVTVLNTNVTVSNKSEVYTVVNGYVDLVQFEKFTFDTTYNDNTVTQTYSYVVVPYEVSAEPDNPDTYKSLIKIVPLTAFIMLVVAAAAMIVSKRD